MKNNNIDIWTFPRNTSLVFYRNTNRAVELYGTYIS